MRTFLHLVLLCFFFLSHASAQTMMPLPPHDAVYSGSIRGYWFVAPTSFTITGLRVPPEAGTNPQFIHVMKCHTPFPIASGSQSTDFTTLTYISNAPNGVIQNVSLQINQGDTIGIFGSADVNNSYSASTTHSSTIAGFPVVLTRFGYQGDINLGPAPSYFGSAYGASGSISRIEMYYSTGPCTDPPTPGMALASTTTVCPGSTVYLNVSGNSVGIGQTYVWESSVLGGPYTPISSSSASPGYSVTPTSATSYRVAVTCGISTTYSTPVNITMGQNISGTFTIDKNASAAPGVFTSFATAMAALSCGVSGLTTFNVAPGSGPYNEQVTIPALSGTSAANTVVINGNGNTIQFTPVSGARHIIKLDGADYVTIDSFNIVGQDIDYGYGIQLSNGADHNIISRCNINLSAVTSTTSANSAGIVGSSSPTSGVGAGNNGNYNLFTGNTITGAYRGVSFVGNVGGLDAVGNTFVNNTIQDFYADGFYLEDNNGTSILGNNIQRPTRTTAATGAGIEANSGNRNLLIDKNRIHDTHTGGATGTFYGIYFTGCDAPLGMENKVTNNLLYKFNSASSTIYALYNSGSDGVWYYHNTIALDHAAATGGTTRGIYQTTAASNIQIKNNIFYITRGGTGTKYVLYFNTATSSIASNNNDLYISAPAGSNYVGYYGSAQATLTNWKAVNGAAFDQQSVSINPLFTAVATGDYTPANVLLDNLGTPVGVSTDLNNNPRSGTTPDMGSYEFLTVPSPLAVKLTSFRAERSAQDVLLNWNVSSEEGLAEYVVERSLDGRSFDEVGRTKAEGKGVYNFTDANAIKAATTDKLYYRLKMAETNGKIAFSNIAIINLQAFAETFSVYPNPFTESIIIMATSEESGTCTITIKDVTGRTVATQTAQVVAGKNSIQLQGLGGLAHGSYQLIIDVNGKKESLKLVK